MNILNAFPAISSALGVFLIIFVLSNKSGLGKSKKIRYVLVSLLFIYVITSLDYYLTINNQISATYSGLSYILYHFTGILFYYFICLYTKSELNIKKWIVLVTLYTLARILVFEPFDEVHDLKDFVASLETSNYGVLVLIEYVAVSLINITLTIFAYKKLKQKPFVIQLKESQKIHYKWIQIIIVTIAFLQVIVFVNTLLGSFDINNFNYYLKFETLIYAMFFFVFAFSIMHFPVFAYTGNFEDLPATTIKKYAKSSLSDSSVLFEQIRTTIIEEQLFLEYDLKLNTLARKVNSSIHHVSQAINQNAKMSFPDYINSFRIHEAKKKLLEEKPDTIFTISLDVGFSSKAAFYTAFKKNTNLTPTAFKKQYKNKES